MSLKSNIFLHEGVSITVGNLCDSLGKYIEYGSDLYIEIDLSGFGSLHPDIKTREQLASNIFLAFSTVSGPNATIIIPSFTFSWGKNSSGIYDVDSPTHLGLMPNWFLNQKNVIRTLDPMYSLLIKGEKARWYSEHCNDSFGKCSTFAKLHEVNAKLIGFGLNKYDPTFIHHVEQFYNENISPIDYRYLKEFKGKIKKNNELTGILRHYAFVRNLSLQGDFSYDKLSSDLIEQDLLVHEEFCNSKIYISDCNSVFDVSMSGLKGDINYFRKKT